MIGEIKEHMVYHPVKRELYRAMDGNEATTQYRLSLRYTQIYYNVDVFHLQAINQWIEDIILTFV